LCKNGLNVTGFDISEKMISLARKNAKRENCTVIFVKSSLEDIPEAYFGKFDLVVSLGNTLANIDKQKLKRVFKKAFVLLKDDGNFLLQVVNIEMMRHSGKRIIGITRDKVNTYIRFYDFHSKQFMFNILRVSAKNPLDYNMSSTKIYSHNYRQLTNYAFAAGFKSCEIYGGLNKSKFQPNLSPDLVINFLK